MWAEPLSFPFKYLVSHTHYSKDFSTIGRNKNQEPPPQKMYAIYAGSPAGYHSRVFLPLHPETAPSRPPQPAHAPGPAQSLVVQLVHLH